jgi:hypothetical protein
MINLGLKRQQFHSNEINSQGESRDKNSSQISLLNRCHTTNMTAGKLFMVKADIGSFFAFGARENNLIDPVFSKDRKRVCVAVFPPDEISDRIPLITIIRSPSLQAEKQKVGIISIDLAILLDNLRKILKLSNFKIFTS